MGAFLNLYRCNVPVGARFISPHASAWGGPRAYKSRPYWEIAPLLGNRAPTGKSRPYWEIAPLLGHLT